MRLKVQMNVQKIPQFYRLYLLSFIKEMIRIGDSELYHELYDVGKRPKCLTYSLYMRQFKLVENEFHMENATLTVSTSDPNLGVAFINGISQTREFLHPQYPFEVAGTQIAAEKHIHTKIVKFKILNAILLEDKNHKPLLIQDEFFERELNIVMNKQFEYLYGRNLYEPIQILEHHLKKQVIQESNRHADGRTLFYTAQKGDITLKGHPEDLQFLYQNGAGNRSSQGYGTLEVISCYD